MLVSILSYPAAGAAGLVVLLCVTSGLYQLCEWIENHAATARSVFIRLIYSFYLFIALTTLVDRLPLGMALICLLAQSSYLFELRSNQAWPFTSTTSPRSKHAAPTISPRLIRTVAFALSLAAHFYSVSAFHALRQEWADYRLPFHPSRRLPGGRVDWDALDPTKHKKPVTPEMGAKEVVTFLAFGVWLSPVLSFLGICASQMGLPTSVAS